MEVSSPQQVNGESKHFSNGNDREDAASCSGDEDSTSVKAINGNGNGNGNGHGSVESVSFNGQEATESTMDQTE